MELAYVFGIVFVLVLMEKSRLQRFHGGRACIPSLPLAVSRVELRHLRHGGILLAGCAR